VTFAKGSTFPGCVSPVNTDPDDVNVKLQQGHELSSHFQMRLQEIDNLIHNNLADIVVELLMTLYEGGGAEGDRGDLKRFIGLVSQLKRTISFFTFSVR